MQKSLLQHFLAVEEGCQSRGVELMFVAEPLNTDVLIMTPNVAARPPACAVQWTCEATHPYCRYVRVAIDGHHSGRCGARPRVSKTIQAHERCMVGFLLEVPGLSAWVSPQEFDCPSPQADALLVEVGAGVVSCLATALVEAY